MTANTVPQFEIQLLNEMEVDNLILALVQNGYKVALRQDKKALICELAYMYFKEKLE